MTLHRSHACPDPVELQRLGVGLLADEEAEALVAHAIDCTACRVALDQICGADEYRASLRAAHDPPSHLDEPECQLAVDACASNSQTLRKRAVPQESLSGVTVDAYELQEVIGHGGMGVVYKALDTRLKRVVAIKMILSGLHARTSDIERFRTEAEAVGRLQHPNIVQIFDYGEFEGRPYLVLEFVAGVRLADLLVGEPVNADLAAELIAQLAAAIHVAHEQRIVHRDLKPGNILMAAMEAADGSTSDGEVDSQSSAGSTGLASQAIHWTGGTGGQNNSREATAYLVKVSDFGLAKDLQSDDQHTGTGQVLGTARYMAPEQALGNEDGIGAAIDTYALGVILYELLTGRAPFVGATVVETLRMVTESEPVPPTELQPRLSRDLSTICLKCLAKLPADRYDSALALEQDLRRWLAGKPIQARPVGIARRLTLFYGRNRLLCNIVLCFLILATAGTAYYISSLTNALDVARLETKKAVESAEKEQQAAVAEKAAKERAQKRLTQVDISNDILGTVFASLDPEAIANSDEPLQALLVEQLNRAAEELEGDAIGDPLVVAKIQVTLGRSLVGLGSPQQAIELLERGTATYQRQFDEEDERLRVGKLALVEAYLNAGLEKKAMPILVAMLRHAEEKYGSSHQQTVECLHLWGRTLGRAKQWEDAFATYQRAIQVSSELHGAADARTLKYKTELARLYHKHGDIEAAWELARELFRTRNEKLGGDHKDTLISMILMAECNLTRNRLDSALIVFEGASQRLAEVLGRDHPETIRALQGVAAVHVKTDRHDLASVIYQELVETMRAKKGPDHAETLLIMDRLGTSLRKMGEPEKGLSYHVYVLDRRKRQYGEEDPRTIVSTNNYASSLQATGELEQALEVFTKNLAIMKKVCQPGDPMLGTGQRNYDYAQKIISAPQRYQDCLDQHGASHEATLTALLDLARRHQTTNKIHQACQCFASYVKHAQDLPELAVHRHKSTLVLISLLQQQRRQEPEAWVTFDCLALVGSAMLEQMDFDAAEDALLHAYRGLIQRRDVLPEHAKSRVAEVAALLVRVYENMDDDESAKEWRKNAELNTVRCP